MAKKYTVKQRAIYHENRLKNSNVSERKKLYSRNWLDGYNDDHAKNNLLAVNSEISARKRAKVSHSDYDIGLSGYKNGLKAKLNK